MILDYFAEYAPYMPLGIERLAVTQKQIEDWNLPTRPAKRSDPEAHKFGETAVELDAIPPDKLCKIVDQAIAELMPPERLEMIELYEASEREILERMVAR